MITKRPSSTVVASTAKITVELFHLLKYLQRTKAIISTPPVEPPPRKVNAQPVPTQRPPKSALIIRAISA